MRRYETDITMILDRSGSMGSIATETIDGFNRFLQEQRLLPGKACLTLVQFDDLYEVLYVGRDLNEVPNLDYDTFQPRGATALLDAIGMSIRLATSRLLVLPVADRPPQTIFVILTDGLENASSRFERRLVFDMIRHQRQTNGWAFFFMGANQDAISEAGSLGIPEGAAMNFESNGRGTLAAFDKVSISLRDMRMKHNGQFIPWNTSSEWKASTDPDAPRSPKSTLPPYSNPPSPSDSSQDKKF
jgi:hypothetical protein